MNDQKKKNISIFFYPELTPNGVKINTKKSFGSSHPIGINKDQEPLRLGMNAWSRYNGLSKPSNFHGQKPLDCIVLEIEEYTIKKKRGKEYIKIVKLSPQSEAAGVIGVAWEDKEKKIIFQFFNEEFYFEEVRIRFDENSSKTELLKEMKKLIPHFVESVIPRFLREKMENK
tara:strand:- start:435 stop:950 length:516 start_codon:yes stop_codon:yes gene_type:complete